MSPFDLGPSPRLFSHSQPGNLAQTIAPSSCKRRYLTRRERWAMILAQRGLCGCGCKRTLDPKRGAAIAEHTSAVALGNGEKPDHIRNKACADRKTYGGRDGDLWTPVGGDIRDIAHAKRIKEGRTQHDRRNARGARLRSNAKLHSRGFDKTRRKKMNGTVELVR